MTTTITITDHVDTETADTIRTAYAATDHGDRTPIAWKHEDPIEEARWVYDDTDLRAIEREDPSLLVRVEERAGHEFAGMLYGSRSQMLRAAVTAWLSADGASYDITQILTATTDEQLVAEIQEAEWIDATTEELMEAFASLHAWDCASLHAWTAVEEKRDTFAVLDGNDVIREAHRWESDESAQAWFARRRNPRPTDSLVVLDLADDEEPRVGDHVTIDDDGVAQLA